MRDETHDIERLSLADWRRRVAELYAEVRAIARADPRGAWDHWRRVREELYRSHPNSPVPGEHRASFRALHFDYDPALRFDAVPLHPAPNLALDEGTLALPNSGSDALDFVRIGTLELPFPGGRRTLSLFWMSGYVGGLFLPFRDATNGTETYGAGRYLLDSAKSADLGADATARTLVLDFNFAYQPSCAFDPKWACPLAPPENLLDVAVRGGERIA